MTRKQREAAAKVCDKIVGGRSLEGTFLRQINRLLDEKKGRKKYG